MAAVTICSDFGAQKNKTRREFKLCSVICGYHSFSLAYLEFHLLFYSSYLRWKFRLLILGLSSFLIYEFSAITLYTLLSLYLTDSEVKVKKYFHFQNIFKFLLKVSLTHLLFKNVLFKLHVFGNFLV